MQVRPYQTEDFETVREWGAAWGAKYDASQFPPTGFIVEGFAAFFIYTTDSSVCFLENLVSNRRADPIQRKKAIEMIVDATLADAKSKGFKVAYATTGIPEVIVRAIQIGATIEHKQALLTKILTDPS